MRVLTIIDSLAVGGAEQSLSMVTPHLVARGVEMHVAYLKGGPGIGEQLQAGGATLHSLDHTNGRLSSLPPTMRLIRSVRADLVHTTLFEADIVGRTAAWLVRVPVVSSFVTESYGPEHYGNPEYRKWKVRGAQLVDAATARFVKRFHAVSSSSADVMSKRLRISREKIDVIARGRDPERLGVRSDARRNRARQEFGLEEGTPLILAAARHFHLKGLDVLVRAFADVVASFPDARLVIAGREGPATTELRRLMAEGGVESSTTLAGYRSDVPDLMCAADIFVLPSRAEGSPGALIESMALQVPTVASDIPSVQELAGTNPQTAALFKVDSPDQMASAIIELLRDSGRSTAMVAAGRKRFLDRYAMSATADATVELYKRCLAGG